MNTKSTGSDADAMARKPYESPRVEVYGDIRDIAKSVGMSGQPDGAAHANTKTS